MNFKLFLFISLLHVSLSAEEKLSVETLDKEVKALNYLLKEVKSGLEYNSKSGFQLAGYASFDWADTEQSNDSFSGVKFAPIFHYQYAEIFQFEGEIEMTITATGETNIELEYAAGTLFINDYMGLQIGKFMSPIGQFVQNQHPSWINKLPSTPLGFGHDGAAPTSNVGVALRGGLPRIAGLRSNYTLFVANPPTFGLADDGDVVIDATGKTVSTVNKTVGGRFGISPIGGMEVGISIAKGEISETSNTQVLARTYDVFDMDFMYHFDAYNFKAEYIQQKIGENTLSLQEGGIWKAWYVQASYQFSSIPLEPVIRYGDYENPETKRKQFAIGLNYLFANSLIAKIAYEMNEDKNNNSVSVANDNRILAQLAFGF